MSLLDSLLPSFLLDLAQGSLTEGEKELAYNLTVIYGLSLLSMVVLYRVLYPVFRSGPEADHVAKVGAVADAGALPSTASALALVKARRSVMPKDLSGELLTRQEVEQVLEAATWAPTHHKNQPWRFTVLEGARAISDYLDFLDTWYSDHKEEIDEQEYSKFQMKLEGARTAWTQQASHVVVLGMARQASEHRAAEWEEVAAVACAVQNLHLCLTTVEGAGGFWSSHTWCRRARDSGEMRDHLGLGDSEDRVLGAFVMGRVKEGKTFKSRRDDWRTKTVWKTESGTQE